MKAKQIIVTACALPIIGLLGYGLTRDPNVIESPLPGREAFDFEAVALDGDTLRLSDLRGRVVVLNFWASWCLACIDEHQYLVEAQARYPDDEVQVPGVVYQDSRANAERWMRRMGGDWPSVLDPRSRIAIDYGVYGVPETYFIGPDGRIAYKQIGPVNREILNGWIQRLLEGRVDVESTDGAGGIPTGRSEGHSQAAPGEPRALPEERGSGDTP